MIVTRILIPALRQMLILALGIYEMQAAASTAFMCQYQAANKIWIQVTELNKRIQGLQAACNDHQHQATIAETQLREELARSAPLHGHHLDRLTASQLEGLARLHERGLKHARALQVHLPVPFSAMLFLL